MMVLYFKNKWYDTYKRLFEALIERISELPNHFGSAYEHTEIKAVNKHIRGVQIDVCYFHFSRSL